MEEYVDIHKIHSQIEYLKRLKKLKLVKLRKYHNETFKDTKYNIRIPGWAHRSIYERRLFYLFCIRNYHYPKKHPIAKRFIKQAKHFLSKQYLKELDNTKLAAESLKNHTLFSKDNIKEMSENEVDRYLVSLGLFVEASLGMKRKVLWEWFHLPAKQLVDHYSKGKDGKVRPRRQGRLSNKWVLRDIILKYPEMGYDEFKAKFGDDMPTVSNASFTQCRTLLRKAGYNIPYLKKGPKDAAIRAGKKARGVYTYWVKRYRRK